MTVADAVRISTLVVTTYVFHRCHCSNDRGPVHSLGDESSSELPDFGDTSQSGCCFAPYIRVAQRKLIGSGSSVRTNHGIITCLKMTGSGQTFT